MVKAILMGVVVVITTALLTWLLVSLALSIAKAVDIREKTNIEGNDQIDILVRYQATEQQCKQYAKLNNLTIN